MYLRYKFLSLGFEDLLNRHNGVIIEPSAEGEKDKDGEEKNSSGSKAGSRSATPTSKGKGKGRGKKNAAAAPNALATPGTAGPSSGNNYYRSHTMGHLQNGILFLLYDHHVVNVIHASGIMLDTHQYTARNPPGTKHQPSWPPPPPWAAEGPPAPQMGTISYHQPGTQPGFYQPASPYYRTGLQANGSAVQQQPPYPQLPQDMQNRMQPPTQNAPPHQDARTSRTGTPANSNLHQQSGDIDMKDDQPGVGEAPPIPAAPVIDPSLDMSSPSRPIGNVTGGAGSHLQTPQSMNKPVSLEITQAAMEAVLQSAQRDSSRASGTAEGGMSGNVSPANGQVHTQGQTQNFGIRGSPQSNGALSVGSNTDVQPRPIVHTTGKSPFAHSGTSTQKPSTPQPPPPPPVTIPAPITQPEHTTRPEPMEPMLTEDGEPMLNPGSLLFLVFIIDNSAKLLTSNSRAIDPGQCDFRC